MSLSFDERVGDDLLKLPSARAEKNSNSHDTSSESGALKGARTDAAPMAGSSDSVITFTVAGLFGAGRLASRLKELESVDLIGPWHIGHWIDYTHKAIRIRFGSRTDARTAVSNVGFSAIPPGAQKSAVG